MCEILYLMYNDILVPTNCNVLTSNINNKNSSALIVASLHHVDDLVVQERDLLVFWQQAVQEGRVVALEFSYASHLVTKERLAFC